MPQSEAQNSATDVMSSAPDPSQIQPESPVKFTESYVHSLAEKEKEKERIVEEAKILEEQTKKAVVKQYAKKFEEFVPKKNTNVQFKEPTSAQKEALKKKVGKMTNMYNKPGAKQLKF